MNAVFCLLVSGALALSVSPVFGQSLDDAAVEAALKAGQSGKFKDLYSSCLATESFIDRGGYKEANFHVFVSRAAGRIARLAENAKRLYQPLGVDDITPEMRDDSVVLITVTPATLPAGTRPENIQQVVLKSKTNRDVVVQPTALEENPVEFANLMGAKFEGNSAKVIFDVTTVRAMPAGDFDVVVVTDSGERRCKVGRADRGRILK